MNTAVKVLKLMLRARYLDDKALLLYKQNRCHFHISVAGHEAIQVAAGEVFKGKNDWFYPYYRDLALVITVGMSDEELLLSYMNKASDPNSHGRQMPMHYGHKDLNIVSQSSPTGTQYLQAVGTALAIKKRKSDGVVYVSSGEGAVSQGDFHEAINWSARDRLPIIFIIQNNLFAISVPISEQIAGGSVYRIVGGFENLGRYEIDGTNYWQSYSAVSDAYRRAKNGNGPSMIEAHVPRLGSHSVSDNQVKYRDPESIANDELRCPLRRLEEELISNRTLTESDLKSIKEEILQDIESAFRRVEKALDCLPETVLDHVVSSEYTVPFATKKFSEPEELPPNGEELTMVDAINQALVEEMEHNPNTLLFGQDVADGKGGVFTVTANLTKRFGAERVFNTQLAESSIIGSAIGLSIAGYKPIAEIQFGDYIWTGMMQLRNEVAMLRYRSGGDFNAPMVVRVPVGGYIRGSHYHSQNIEAFFAHIPGLLIIMPSNAADAKGLLKTAIRGDDPVLFLEHKGLYRQPSAKSQVYGAEVLIPFGLAKVVRYGTSVTVVTWGMLVSKALQAAKLVSDEYGIECEIIDCRSLVPLDKECILESVRKTNRSLVAHEDLCFMGYGAEIAALISEECFSHLDAPVRRLGMKYLPAVPHAESLEEEALPQVEDLVKSIIELANF